MNREICHCIYCNTAEDLSESDIIPDFMTNGKMLNKRVCHVTHNSQFSDDFENYVYEKLKFLLNQLDIKSSKANYYPSFDSEIKIDDITYELKNIRSENEAFRRPVTWNKGKEKMAAFGDPKVIEKIAASKSSDNIKVEEVDINDKKVSFIVHGNLDVFYSQYMFRTVAKIAYEWYCVRNNIDGMHDEFREIIDYIANGFYNGDDRVSLVADYNVIKKFCEVENSGGHLLVLYVDNKGGISALVYLLSVVLYNVKICDSIPDFTTYNCLIQHIRIDGKGNKEQDCIKYMDYSKLDVAFIDVTSDAQSLLLDNSFESTLVPVTNVVKIAST